MAIKKVLAGVAVGDFDSARDWYGRLLGRTPDAEPMEGLAERNPSEYGGIQLVEDGERAGSSVVRADRGNPGACEGGHGGRPGGQPDHVRGVPHRRGLKRLSTQRPRREILGTSP